MKEFQRERRARILTIRLKSNPLKVWLSNRRGIAIEPGDTIDKVVQIIAREKWGLDERQLQELVGYWFTLGERASGGRLGEPLWSVRELQSDPRRRYLPK